MESRGKILIIEDDRLMVASITDILVKEGYQVNSTHSSSQAQPLLSAAHLAIIDLHLPDKPGIEVFKELKQANPEAEGLIITGYADLHSSIEAINLGVFAYLEKPVRPDKLLLDIKRALERRSLMVEVKRREQEIKGLTGFTSTILNERVLLLQEAMQNEKKLSSLYRGISHAFQSSDPAQAGGELLPLIAEITGANMLSIALIGSDKKVIKNINFFKGMGPLEMTSRTGGHREEILRTLRPINIPSLAKCSNIRAELLSAGIKSSAIYPLIVDGRVYAILFLHSLEENAFEGQEEALASFADLCAIPLKQSILYQEIEKSREEWEAMVRDMRAGVVLVNGEKDIIRANRAFSQMIKKPLDELAGKKVCELAFGQHGPAPDCPVEKAMASGKRTITVIDNPYLGIKKLEIISFPVNTRGETSRFLHIFRDLEALYK